MERADSPHKPLSELPEEDSQPQDPSEEPDEGSKLSDVTEQNEDSRSQDPNDQSEGRIQIPLETSEQPSSEEREGSTTPVSGSLGKSSTDWLEDTSSIPAPEPSTSSRRDFLSSDTRPEGTQDLTLGEDSQEILEPSESEELPLSSWEKRRTEWTFERPGHPVPREKPSFHRHCCSSMIEEIIKQSPLKFAKSRGLMQEWQAPNFKGSEISSPYERMRKQRIPVGLKRKKESKGLKGQPHTTGLSEGRCSYLGRRSKALYNLYTTFCDEEEEAGPGFLQGTEGSPAVSGVSRACTIFSVLKKGRINVSNLLLTLHTMGILMTRADMHQALRCIPVDEGGNLNFLEFLNVVSHTTRFAGTEALRKAWQVFRKLKKDMVAVEDLETMLACLGVTVDPTIIKQALRCVQITWDGKLNISNFLSTVRGLQSCSDTAAYLDEYPSLNRRSFGDMNNVRYLEHRWKSKCPLGRQTLAHRTPLIAFCSAEEAIAFTELQKQESQPERPAVSEKPSAASSVCPAEENGKKKGIMKWPQPRPCFGYSSQDTLFPIESSLGSKKSEEASAQREAGGEDSPSPLSQPNITPKVNQPKKKRLSFSLDLPKRYSADETRVPSFTLLEAIDKRGTEDPSAQ